MVNTGDRHLALVKVVAVRGADHAVEDHAVQGRDAAEAKGEAGVVGQRVRHV